MDYEEIIELLQSGEAGQEELSRLSHPRRKRAIYLDESAADELVSVNRDADTQEKISIGLSGFRTRECCRPPLHPGAAAAGGGRYLAAR